MLPDLERQLKAYGSPVACERDRKMKETQEDTGREKERRDTFQIS